MARKLDQSWRAWLITNAERGCNPEQLLSAALKQGFDRSEILSILSRHQPSEKKTVAIESLNVIDFAVDRCREIFVSALSSLVSERSNHPGTQKLPLFTYVDTIGGKHSCPEVHSRTVFKLVDRAVTNKLADKGRLGEAVTQLGLGHCFPRTFSSVEETIDALKERPFALAFVKGRYGTAGDRIRCIKTSDLPAVVLSADEIIQEGVDELELIDGRKATLRMYILFFSGRCWLSGHAFAVVHGAAYDSTSENYEIQIKHSGYAEKGSPVRLIPLSKLPNGPRWLETCRSMLSHMKPLFDPLLAEAVDGRYALLGIDALPTLHGDLRFIEVNNFPNLVHTKDVNSAVNVPMIKSLLQGLLYGDINGSLLSVDFNPASSDGK